MYNIFRHETERKWIKALQIHFSLYDNIYHERNISKMPDFDVLSLLDFRKCNGRSHALCKDDNLNLNVNTKLFGNLQIYVRSSNPDVIKCFQNCLHLVLLPFVYWMRKLINSMIENITSTKQLFLLDASLNMLFVHILTRKLIIYTWNKS